MLIWGELSKPTNELAFPELVLKRIKQETLICYKLNLTEIALRKFFTFSQLNLYLDKK